MHRVHAFTSTSRTSLSPAIARIHDTPHTHRHHTHPAHAHSCVPRACFLHFTRSTRFAFRFAPSSRSLEDARARFPVPSVRFPEPSSPFSLCFVVLHLLLCLLLLIRYLFALVSSIRPCFAGKSRAHGFAPHNTFSPVTRTTSTTRACSWRRLRIYAASVCV